MTAPVQGYGYGRGSYGSLNYGSDVATAGANTLLVRGTAPVLPQIKIYGPCKGPTLTFNTVGTSLYLKGLVINDGDYLLIDVPSKQVILNGDFEQTYYSYLSLSKADGWNGWAYLVEGLNDITFLTETQGDGCKVEITWRDEWI